MSQKQPSLLSSPTPMMQQYLGIKQHYQDYLLFYHMGDFYELFFNDAIIAAEVLDIALTKRGKHDDQEIPMCGVPCHSYEPYLHKLIRAGYKVALCEQTEKPEEAKKRGYKAVVRREVTRLITPGTLTEDTLLEAKESHYLACVATAKGAYAMAWLDLSTGEFHTSSMALEQLTTELSRLSISELLISHTLYEEESLQDFWRQWKGTVTAQATSTFNSMRAQERMKNFWGVESFEALGAFSHAELTACGALLEYIELTQKGTMPALLPPKKHQTDSVMRIDAATRASLELTRTLAGEKKGSLLQTIDRTISCAGGRLLHQYLSSPLLEVHTINQRLERVTFFYDHEKLRHSLRDILSSMPDMERAFSRLYLGRGGPRDLVAIRQGLHTTLKVAELFEYVSDQCQYPLVIQQYLSQLSGKEQLLTTLMKALNDEVPTLARDGGFVKAGYHPRIDELRELQQSSKHRLAALCERYRDETGIRTLKITRNNVLGYYVEVTPVHADRIPTDVFVHRQTLASAVRFTTDELKKLESDIINAKDVTLSLESEVFAQLVEQVKDSADVLALVAQAMAVLDVSSALSELAQEQNYVCPVVDDSLAFSIQGGRHPIVSAVLDAEGAKEFVPNNAVIQHDHKVWLLTGPNMAGKSTFLRQNALIGLLAQMGSYVPADYAHIGVIDRLFSRVGASDNLARGQSTFMIEMLETATILHQATERSFVILDEIGRGTATFDGLSIAWACLEHIHTAIGCRTLFATHYHELTQLEEKLASLACYSMQVREWEGDVVFLHQVIEGKAEHSYGLYVAKLAGLPTSVIRRAHDVLRTLESSQPTSALKEEREALPLPFDLPSESEVEAILSDIDVDACSPRDALDHLYQLKKALVC